MPRRASFLKIDMIEARCRRHDDFKARRSSHDLSVDPVPQANPQDIGLSHSG